MPKKQFCFYANISTSCLNSNVNTSYSIDFLIPVVYLVEISIAADLHMEHLNKIMKECIEAVGSNKTEHSIIRAGNAIGIIDTVLDKENGLAINSGHKLASYARDHLKVVGNLKKNKVFCHMF